MYLKIKPKQHFSAIKFTSEDFHNDSNKYPMIFDKAMFSSAWVGKTADEGRYYMLNQTNIAPFTEHVLVAEDEYIIEGMGGWLYTITEQDFLETFDVLEASF